MARAALSRRAIDGPNVSKLTKYTGPEGRRLFVVWRLGEPLMALTDPSYTSHLDWPKMARLK